MHTILAVLYFDTDLSSIPKSGMTYLNLSLFTKYLATYLREILLKSQMF